MPGPGLMDDYLAALSADLRKRIVEELADGPPYLPPVRRPGPGSGCSRAGGCRGRRRAAAAGQLAGGPRSAWPC